MVHTKFAKIKQYEGMHTNMQECTAPIYTTCDMCAHYAHTILPMHGHTMGMLSTTILKLPTLPSRSPRLVCTACTIELASPPGAPQYRI